MKRMAFLWLVCIVTTAFCNRAAGQNNSIDSLFNQARQLLNSGQFANAVAAYEQCFRVASDKKDTLLMGNAMIGIGIAHDQSGRYHGALDHYFKALRLYEKAGLKTKVGGTLKNIGNTYRVLKAYDKAAYYLQEALIIQYHQKDSARIAMVLSDIGSVYMELNSLPTARQYFELLVARYSRHMSHEVRAYVFNNLALTYARERSYQQALPYYQSGLALMKQIHSPYGTALILDNIGDLYYKKGQYPKALDYHLQSLAIIQNIKSNDLLRCSYNYLARTYFSMGNYKKAYEYVAEEVKLKDTIYKEESRKSYAEMEAKYQNEKKQTEIVLLQQNNKIASIELSAQRRTSWLLVIVIALILLVTFSLYKSYAARKKANTALNTLNQQLQEANSAKAKLISIISHDLRSPVSSLFHFLQLQKASPQMNATLSQSAENLLEAMEDLLIWSKTQMEHFTPSPELIDAGELLEEIIRLNEPFAAGKKINLYKEAEDLEFEADANFLKIILRNLTGNAIKFTPAGGAITLSAVKDGSDIIFTVRDNGPGIPVSDINAIFEWNSIRSDSSGLGLKLAREFAEKLKGKISVESEPGKGAAFVVCIPRGH